MALFRIKVRFEQVIELDVHASSPRGAEARAVERVMKNEVRPEEVISSVRVHAEAVDGATVVASS